MRHARLGLLAALAAVSIAGCHSSDSSDESSVDPTTRTSNVSSADLRPSDMRISGDVLQCLSTTPITIPDCTGTDDVSVLAVFYLYYPAGQKHVRLGEGDALTFCVGSVCKPMARPTVPRVFLPDYRYEATLPYVAETAYTISFSRHGDAIAPNTTVTLPVPFTILTPPAGLTVTDGQVIDVLWSPSGVERTTNAAGQAHCDHPSGETTTRGLTLLFRSLDPGAIRFNVDDIMTRSSVPCAGRSTRRRVQDRDQGIDEQAGHRRQRVRRRHDHEWDLAVRDDGVHALATVDPSRALAMGDHTCDRKGPPAKVIDESCDEPITGIYPTCSVCGKPQVFLSPRVPNQNDTPLTDISVSIAAIRANQMANGAIAATSKRDLENHIAAAL